MIINIKNIVYIDLTNNPLINFDKSIFTKNNKNIDIKI